MSRAPLPNGWSEEDRDRFLAEQHRAARAYLDRVSRAFEKDHPRDPRTGRFRKRRRLRIAA